MQIQSQGEAVKDSIPDDLPKMMTETGQKLMEKQEQVLISIIEKMREHVKGYLRRPCYVEMY